jgi:hypothetical protein
MFRSKGTLVVSLFVGLVVIAPLVHSQALPPSIVAGGLPAVPCELRERMNQHLNMPSAISADWHPTERSILLLTHFGHTS